MNPAPPSNGFLKEVNRHFNKYSPYQKSRMFFKFSLALTVFSLVLTATGVFVDQFHEDDPQTFTLRNGATFFSAGVTVGHLRLRMDFPECTTPETAARQQSRLFNPEGVLFSDLVKGPTGTDEVYDAFLSPGEESMSETYFGTFETYYMMGRIAICLSYAALGLLVLSAIISIFTQTPPNSFMSSEPTLGQSHSDYMWGSIHHGLTVVAAVFMMIDLAIVSTYLDLVLGRVIEMGFELCNFNPGGGELDIMRIYGDFLEDYSRVNGATGMAYKVSIGLILFQSAFVFLVGINRVRERAMNDDSRSLTLPASKLRQLPWYCTIWKIQFAVVFLFIAIVADVGTSVYTRTHGYALNLYAFRTVGSARTGSGSTATGALSDMIMDLTSTYYISDSIPGVVAVGWIPFVIALGLGSTDPTRFFSKTTQLFGLLIAFRAVLSMCTIVPVPSTVITTPFCYDPPESVHFELRTIFDRSLGCNHSMFSGYAAFTTISIGIIIMYVRYGPMKRRIPGYILLGACGIVSALLPVVARMNYSFECYVALVIASLLLFTQSAAFKLLFRYNINGNGKSKLSAGELVNDKIAPLMEECMNRIRQYNMGVKLSPALHLPSSEFEEIVLLYEAVGRAVKIAKEAQPIKEIGSAGKLITVAPAAPRADTPSSSGDPAADLVSVIIENQSIQLHQDGDAIPTVNNISNNDHVQDRPNEGDVH
jgi:hypothetical protein